MAVGDKDFMAAVEEAARALESWKSYGVLEKSTLRDNSASVLFLERAGERISKLGLYHIHFYPEERALYVGHLVDCGLNRNVSLSCDMEEPGDYREIPERWINLNRTALEIQLAGMKVGVAQEVDFRNYLERFRR